MLKNILFAAVTLAALAAATPAHATCDISALQAGKDYSPSAYSKLTSDADKENFCLARTFVKRVKAGEAADSFTLEDIPVRMSRFVTAEEYDSVRGVLGLVMGGGNEGSPHSKPA